MTAGMRSQHRLSETRGMVPEDITRLVEPGDPRLSPDGSMVAFSVTTMDGKANEYRSRIWLVPADGSSKPRAFTAGKKRDARPRWSPDGSHLAFVSHRDEKGSQLYVMPVATGGEAVELATSAEEIEQVAWAPDGESIAYTVRVRDEDHYGKEKEKDRPPRRVTRLRSRLENVGWVVDRPRHLFVVPADGSGEPVALTSGEHEVGGFTWSPDSTRLTFTSARHESWDLDWANDLFTVGAGGGEPVQLTQTGRSYERPSWSSDGRSIAVMVDLTPLVGPSHTQIAVLPASGGEPVLLTQDLDRQCAPFVSQREPVWDGTDVLFQVEDHGATHLYRAPADGTGKPELVLGGHRTIKSFDAVAGALVVAVSDATTTTELYAFADGKERKLTSFGRSFAKDLQFAEPERFVATSADGTEVEAWVMRPVGYEPGKQYPTLLNIHGGPFTQYGLTFFDEFQVEAGAGYAVVYANPRGSSGYTEAWGQAIRGPLAEEKPGSGWGGVDYEDLMAAVDEAVSRFDFIDPDRIGLMGGSYGGYMTSWIIGHTDRFRAACTERGVNNLISLEYGSDGAGVFRTMLGNSHLDEPEEYLRQSPITYVRNITTPTLILHSEGDTRCPIEQADQLFVALRMLGREVEFVRFPGEGHELSRSGAPRHRVQRMEVILEWFERHLGEMPDPPTG